MLIDKIFEEFKALLPDNEAYEGYCEDVVLKKPRCSPKT